jgi:hypothetical protein
MIFAEIVWFVNIKIQLSLRGYKDYRYTNQRKSNGIEKKTARTTRISTSLPCPRNKNILLCAGQSAIVFTFMRHLNTATDSITIDIYSGADRHPCSLAAVPVPEAKPVNTLNIPAC